ncbi:unnamed protein product [Dibothriocephalus latus]|uniref:Uncharacterized protein n=1 Tax=Dibothriocephalus latus TaxID=60516 RepID=A0A3P7ND14_DIBLA|nr:unnamed protein product [Dibothriocephalus latus]
MPDESPVGAPGDEDLAISLAIDALQQCSAEAEAPVLIFVSKVFWTDKQKSLHSSQPPAPWPSHSTKCGNLADVAAADPLVRPNLCALGTLLLSVKNRVRLIGERGV